METKTTTTEPRVLRVTVPAIAYSHEYVGLQAYESTPAEFLAAFEDLRTRIPGASLGWDYGGQRHPMIAYEDGDVNVRIAGPKLLKDEPEPPDAEATLRLAAAHE